MPSGLPIVACIRCGRALHEPRPAAAPVPSHFIVVGAAILVELLCASAFVLAAVWMLKARDTSAFAIAALALAMIGMFAGAKAYRGSVAGLKVGAALVAAIAVLCLAHMAGVTDVLRVVQIIPALTGEAARLLTGVGGAAIVATLACLAALPQARRFTAWQEDQIERAFPSALPIAGYSSPTAR